MDLSFQDIISIQTVVLELCQVNLCVSLHWLEVSRLIRNESFGEVSRFSPFVQKELIVCGRHIAAAGSAMRSQTCPAGVCVCVLHVNMFTPPIAISR